MTDAIEALLQEDRRFPPPSAFTARARVASPDIYDEAEADFRAFWQQHALSEISWYREPAEVLDDSNPPFYRWFADGELNMSYNCLDRHIEARGGDKTAYVWIGEPGDERRITYTELRDEVARCANALKALGVERGDRVAIYMGMVPELPIAMLACTRIGAAHSVVFGGFSSTALADRIQDASCKALVTCDGAWRRGQVVPLKDLADAAVADCPSIEHVLVVRRTENEVAWTEGRDVWWHDAVPGASADCEPERMGSEDVLYLLYTSGTTAKPKGICHTTAGYLLGTMMTHRWVFDVRDDDVYWCAADCGWVTGHSYIVYGPLANHTTGVLYEGTPEHPTWSRHWEIIERYGVTIYYTAPTAIRAFVKCRRRARRPARPVEPAAARLGRRADQPGGVDLVPRADRRRPLPDRRHLVADGDGRDHDLAAARDHDDEAGLRHAPAAGDRCRDLRRAGERGAPRRWRLPRAAAAVAVDAAHDCGATTSGSSQTPGAGSAAACTSRATARDGRRRRLLADGPRRRRDQRGRAPALDHGDRVEPRPAPRGGRGGRDRPPRPQSRASRSGVS